MKLSIQSALVISLLGLAPLAAHAEGTEPAKAATCYACHGPAGAKPILPEYPLLAGQHYNYLSHSLQEYKSGKRKNAVMNAQAASLSDDEIKELSKFFSAQTVEGALYTPVLDGPAPK